MYIMPEPEQHLPTPQADAPADTDEFTLPGSDDENPPLPDDVFTAGDELSVVMDDQDLAAELEDADLNSDDADLESMMAEIESSVNDLGPSASALDLLETKRLQSRRRDMSAAMANVANTSIDSLDASPTSTDMTPTAAVAETSLSVTVPASDVSESAAPDAIITPVTPVAVSLATERRPSWSMFVIEASPIHEAQPEPAVSLPQMSLLYDVEHTLDQQYAVRVQPALPQLNAETEAEKSAEPVLAIQAQRESSDEPATDAHVAAPSADSTNVAPEKADDTVTTDIQTTASDVAVRTVSSADDTEHVQEVAVPAESETATVISETSTETATVAPETATDTVPAETATVTPESATVTPETAAVTPETATMPPETATVTAETATVTYEPATVTPETAAVTSDKLPQPTMMTVEVAADSKSADSFPAASVELAVNEPTANIVEAPPAEAPLDSDAKPTDDITVSVPEPSAPITVKARSLVSDPRAPVVMMPRQDSVVMDVRHKPRRVRPSTVPSTASPRSPSTVTSAQSASSVFSLPPLAPVSATAAEQSEPVQRRVVLQDPKPPVDAPASPAAPRRQSLPQQLSNSGSASAVPSSGVAAEDSRPGSRASKASRGSTGSPFGSRPSSRTSARHRRMLSPDVVPVPHQKEADTVSSALNLLLRSASTYVDMYRISPDPDDDEPMHVIVLDCQGIENSDGVTSSTDDATLLAICILLSSVLIVKDGPAVSRQWLQRLSLAGQFAQYLLTRMEFERSDSIARMVSPPALLFALSDVHQPIPSPMEQSGVDFALSFDEQLQQAIREHDRASSETFLAEVFARRACVPMPCPFRERRTIYKDDIIQTDAAEFVSGKSAVSDETPRDNSSMYSGETPSLEVHDFGTLAAQSLTAHGIEPCAEYQQQVDVLRQVMLDLLLPKTIGTRVVTGPLLAEFLLRLIVTANTHSSSLCVPSPWRGAALSTNSAAVEDAVKYYDDHMGNALARMIPVEQDQIDVWHSQFLEVAVRSLRERAVGMDISVFEEALKHRIIEYDVDGIVVGGLFFKYATQNDMASQLFCYDVLRKYSTNCDTEVAKRTFVDIDEYDALKDDVVQRYSLHARGPQKAAVLDEFSHHRRVERVLIKKLITSAALCEQPSILPRIKSKSSTKSKHRRSATSMGTYSSPRRFQTPDDSVHVSDTETETRRPATALAADIVEGLRTSATAAVPTTPPPPSGAKMSPRRVAINLRRPFRFSSTSPATQPIAVLTNYNDGSPLGQLSPSSKKRQPQTVDELLALYKGVSLRGVSMDRMKAQRPYQYGLVDPVMTTRSGRSSAAAEAVPYLKKASMTQ
eukprot:TRINITY_DN7545_c0_g1_i2.p1 TRINITY_DN7545_c0_g1~~TRINITY_DN7545_c0_g1_i2.p1  ORF type:complete len:1432 (-),score=358.27 TRINITY_DN7545_c0_g1_i2:134-4096(-)